MSADMADRHRTPFARVVLQLGAHGEAHFRRCGCDGDRAFHLYAFPSALRAHMLKRQYIRIRIASVMFGQCIIPGREHAGVQSRGELSDPPGMKTMENPGIYTSPVVNR